MKRQPLILSVALLFVVSAALWGANYRLDHPPVSPADIEFRARVGGANGTVIRQKKPVGFVARRAPLRVLDAAQTRALIETLRLSSPATQLSVAALSPLELTFERDGQPLARFELYQASEASELETLEKPYRVYRLHPRFHKSLRQMLNQSP